MRHGRARLFHVHYKPLYAAIGEPDNRFRRPMTLARAVERLMVLDAVMADRSMTWLATERDKVSLFHRRGRAAPRSAVADVPLGGRGDRPVLPRQAARSALATMAVTHVFLYLVTRSTPMDFRLFLERHAELLRSLPAWTIRLLVPRHLADAAGLPPRGVHGAAHAPAAGSRRR